MHEDITAPNRLRQFGCFPYQPVRTVPARRNRDKHPAWRGKSISPTETCIEHPGNIGAWADRRWVGFPAGSRDDRTSGKFPRCGARHCWKDYAHDASNTRTLRVREKTPAPVDRHTTAWPTPENIRQLSYFSRRSPTSHPLSVWWLVCLVNQLLTDVRSSATQAVFQ